MKLLIILIINYWIILLTVAIALTIIDIVYLLDICFPKLIKIDERTKTVIYAVSSVLWIIILLLTKFP